MAISVESEIGMESSNTGNVLLCTSKRHETISNQIKRKTEEIKVDILL